MSSSLVNAYQEVQAGSTEDLVVRHAPLVNRIAFHLKVRLPQSVQHDDLCQASMLGLLEAATKYDAGKGASFETYAGIRIKGAMLDEIRWGDWVPRSVHRNVRSLTAAIRKVESESAGDASDQAVARELGVPLETYYEMLKDAASSKLFSFEDLPGEESAAFEDPEAVGPFDVVVEPNFQQALAEASATLPEREQLVLSLYYDDELNLREIGEVLGVTESRISQIHSKAALRLRARLEDWLP